MSIQKKVFVVLALILEFGDLCSQVNISSSDIPIILINTNGQEIPDEPKINAEMKIISNDLGVRNYIADPEYSYNGNIRIEIRGSTSQFFPKKQYAIETCDHDKDELNVSLLGLPSENDWILYAPYSDKSLIRNVLAYAIAQQTGHYASRARFCELVLNDEYMGIYVLFEKIKRDRSRVDISRLSSDDITGDDLTGGYIVKIDKTTGDSCESFYCSYSNTDFQYHYPDCDDIMPEQKTYIQNFIREFEEALFSKHFQDPVDGYYKYVDLNSFIDYMIVNEIAKNIDAYRLSTFMYKTKDSKGGKLHMGPVWDFNIAFGNVDYYNGFNTDSLVIKNQAWWIKLNEDSVFTKALATRWYKLRDKKLSNGAVLHLIDSLTNILTESSERNFTKWDILGQNIWPNYFVGENYKEEIDFLKTWVLDRLYWLDYYFIDASEPPFYDYKNSLSAYPNPVQEYLTIVFKLEKAGAISIKIYDIMGQLREVVISDKLYNSGFHQEPYSLTNGSLSSLQQGIYLLVLEQNNKILSKMKIIKN